MITFGRFFYSSHKQIKPVRLGSSKLVLPAKIEEKSEVSLLDKKWNEKPMSIIKSPHKLTEVELYATL